MLSPTSRWLTRALAALYAILGAILFLAPEWSAASFSWNISPFVAMTIGGWCLGNAVFAWEGARVWPWTLTPLTARVIGGWFALPGVSALLMARDGRWSASRVVVLAGAVLAALILAGIARAWGDFDPSNPLTWVYAALIALTLLGFGALYLGMETHRRRKRAANRNALVTLDRRD